MADFRPRYNELLKQRKSDLEDQFRGLLPSSYRDSLTGNPNAGYLEGAFKRIAPDEDPYEFVKTWQNYNSSWNKGKSAATALRMLLTEQVGLPCYEVISGYTKPTLSKIILGIEAADEGVPRGEELHVPLTLPEDIHPPLSDPPRLPKQSAEHSRDLIPLTDMKRLISTYGNPSGKFAVYVLDCTPLRNLERTAMWELRRDALAKFEAGYELNEKEEYAQALNEGERIYYVGYTNDIIDRIQRHEEGAASGGAYFTNFFMPRGVIDIDWFDSESEARNAESQRSSNLTKPGESRAYYS